MKDDTSLEDVQRVLLVIQPTADMLCKVIPKDDVVCALLWLANDIARGHGIQEQAANFYKLLSAVGRDDGKVQP